MTIRDILEELSQFTPDSLAKEMEDQAEQAINAYILGEVEAIIGDDEPVEMEYIRTNTGEILGLMTDDIVTPQLNRLRQELRNKANKKFGGK